jgi:glycosyltransferase involved in cell wall biosynthesis
MMNAAAVSRLLCVYQHAPTPGAPGIYRHRIYLGELVRRGWIVDLVSTPINYMTGEIPPRYRHRLYTRETIEGIEHHWVRASSGIHASKERRALNYITFAAAAATRALTLPRPDVILVSSPPLSVGALGPLLAARFRAPWILEVRDVWPESAVSVGWLRDGTALYRSIERVAHRLASSAAAVIVPTPGLVDDVQRHGARRVEIVPGPVLDSPPDDETRRRVRATLKIAESTCVFLYAGAIGMANGLDLLLDAVSELPPEIDAAVLIAGDGSAREALERRLGEESIERIRMLGVVPKDDVRELLSAADVCLHLLRPHAVFTGAQPTKMLEYLGAHRPVITTVPGLPEELAVSSGGAFASSAEALTAELRRWTGMTPEERRTRGEQSFRYGSERFGLKPSADTLEQLLLGTIG